MQTEAIQDGGIVLELPKEFYVSPYQTFVRPEHLVPVTDLIERMYDDQAFYQMYMTKALAVGGRYNADDTMKLFLEVVTPLLIAVQEARILIRYAHDGTGRRECRRRQ